MKTTQELKELLYKNKTVADQQPDAIAEANAFCEGYKAFLNAAKTEREAAAYDEAAVQANMQAKSQPHTGCPGSMARSMERAPVNQPASFIPMPSQLRQWPVQIKLVPVNAPYFDGASLLIAADCTAYAYANFHQDFIRGKVTLVGCPKLDDVDYSEKLTEILRQNNIKSVTVVRMEVPCCGGLEYAVRTALQNCGKLLPWQVKTISIKGELLDD